MNASDFQFIFDLRKEKRLKFAGYIILRSMASLKNHVSQIRIIIVLVRILFFKCKTYQRIGFKIPLLYRYSVPWLHCKNFEPYYVGFFLPLKNKTREKN